MQDKPSLLIVEDEAAIRAGLVDVFVYHGYQVATAADGELGLRMALSGRHDLILLDVMLPGRDGFAILAELRRRDREQAVIMLTARSSDEDIIAGLQLGADDYIAKPFSVTQLVLRVQAVLRRTLGEPPSPQPLQLRADLQIDPANLCARQQADDGATREITFTRREMQLLQYLAQHHQRAVPRTELLHKVWGFPPGLDIETRTVDIHVAKLRRKIERDPAQPQSLITVRGGGYRLLLAA